jgi:ABC-type uncharacterized transport system permease subunit
MYDDLSPRPHYIQRAAGIGVLGGVIAAALLGRSIPDAAFFGVVAGSIAGSIYGWLRRP